MNTYHERFKTAEQRFWSKIDKVGNAPNHCPELGRCWKWMAGKFSNGYSAFHVIENGIKKLRKGHRFSYALHFGTIPDGICVCHKCDNVECCNPMHLFLGTRGDNVRDAVKKGRMRSGENHPLRQNPKLAARGQRLSNAMKESWVANRGTYMAAAKKKAMKGESNPNSKLKNFQIIEIRRIYATGEIGLIQLGRQYGVSHGTVALIVTGKLWAHV